MGLLDLLMGRKNVVSEKVDFETAERILKDANLRGVDNFNVAFAFGPSVTRENRSYATVIDMLTGFVPHERVIDGEWIYKQEVEGSHQEYICKGKEVHYLTLNQILYGGVYRGRDGGKKPHKEGHYIKIRFELPRNSPTNQLPAITAFFALLGSLFFIGSSLTGNAIGSLSKNSSSMTGVLLFFLGIINTFIYLRKK